MKICECVFFVFSFKMKSPVTSKGKQRRGPKLENDFHSSDSSLEDEETQRRRRVPGSRPNSGSSSRPHSGSTASRPQSGTSSRPTSGSTSRPQSGTASRPKSGSSRSHNVPNKPTSPISQDHSSGYSSSNTLVSKCNKNASKPPRKETIDLSAVHLPRSGDSPELRVSTQLPTHRSDRMNGSVSGGGSVSRMSRKSVKEIPKDDVRLSVIKSSEVGVTQSLHTFFIVCDFVIMCFLKNFVNNQTHFCFFLIKAIQ